MKIEIRRKEFLHDRTLGGLWVDGQLYCHTLEDTARAAGVKIPGKTCVPPCVATLIVSMSNRFKRLMVMASTEENGYEIVTGPYDLDGNGAVSFKGIRFHGGNEPEHTEGCVLVANKRDGNRIYQTAEKKLTSMVQDALLDGQTVTCEWINCV